MRGLLPLTALAALLLPAGSAVAHNSYTVAEGKVVITLGEQQEPVYTYDWTNLDLFVREDAVNGTGGWVQGVEETVEASLIAPGEEELTMPLRPQFRTVGRYQFEDGYQLTQAGQYSVRLEGSVNGSDVSGTYLMPGPREDMDGFTFPDKGVLDLVELKAENEGLSQQISALEGRLAALETEHEAEDDTALADSPGFAAPLALLALAGIALFMNRRRLA